MAVIEKNKPVDKIEKNKTEKIGMVSSKSVEKHTKKNWDQWIEILNQAGAQHWNHKEIVAFLKKKYKLSMWWQQGVTSGYEIAIGRRVMGQNLKGEYSTTVTKTFPIGAKAAWKLICSPEGLAVWLKPLSDFELKPKRSFECEGEIYGEVRTMKAGQRARLSWKETEWDKATVMQVMVIPRPKNKCMVIFQHESIKDSRTKQQLHARWRQAANDLAELAASAAPTSK